MAENKELGPAEHESQTKLALSRREVLKKYGAYTAPVVVSMLLPEQAYGMNGGTAYSSVLTCQANHTMRQAMNGHCASMHPIGP